MIDERWQKRVKEIDRGLYIDTMSNEIGNFYQIMHKDDRTGLVRKVLTVMDKEGNPAPLDLQALNKLRHSVSWDMVMKYPDPEKMAEAFLKEYQHQKTKTELERKGWMLDFNRDHRKDWAQAFNQWKHSLTPYQLWRMKEQEKKRLEERKIIVS